MARTRQYVTDEEQRAANANRQANWRQRQSVAREQALGDCQRQLCDAREAARQIVAEALTHIPYFKQTDIKREWVKRWPWLKAADESKTPG